MFTGRLFSNGYVLSPLLFTFTQYEFNSLCMHDSVLSLHTQTKPNHCEMLFTKAMAKQKRPVKIYRPLLDCWSLFRRLLQLLLLLHDLLHFGFQFFGVHLPCNHEYAADEHQHHQERQQRQHI